MLSKASPNPMSRRAFIARSFAAGVVAQTLDADAIKAQTLEIADHGPVRPSAALPSLTLLRNNGVSATLESIAIHHATALQLMFTRCTTTCPMQGAIFERVQALLPNMASHNLQLISLSVDPKSDTPHELSEWLQMFHSGPSWIAASPSLAELATVKSFFGAGRDALDPHSTQTHILDRTGRLVYRTFELAPPEEIASLLKRV